MGKLAFLDTHVALWLAQGDSRITANVLRDINSHSETLISSISVAELEVKAAKGNIKLPANWVQRFQDAGIKIAPFTAEHAQELGRFPSLLNHDPFDRMILAHAASIRGVKFYTADEVLAELQLLWIVDCR